MKATPRRAPLALPSRQAVAHSILRDGAPTARPAPAGLFNCPLAMTDGAARLCEVLLMAAPEASGQAGSVQRSREGLPADGELHAAMAEALRHLTSREPSEFWTSGQVCAALYGQTPTVFAWARLCWLLSWSVLGMFLFTVWLGVLPPALDSAGPVPLCRDVWHGAARCWGEFLGSTRVVCATTRTSAAQQLTTLL